MPFLTYFLFKSVWLWQWKRRVASGGCFCCCCRCCCCCLLALFCLIWLFPPIKLFVLDPVVVGFHNLPPTVSTHWVKSAAALLRWAKPCWCSVRVFLSYIYVYPNTTLVGVAFFTIPAMPHTLSPFTAHGNRFELIYVKGIQIALSKVTSICHWTEQYLSPKRGYLCPAYAGLSVLLST